MKSNPVPTTLYHYTFGHKLPGILKAQALLPFANLPQFEARSSGIIVHNKETAETPLLWLSRNAQFEQTSLKNKMSPTGPVRMSLSEMFRLSGVFRFKWDCVAPSDVLNFQQACQFNRISHKERQLMTNRGLKWGASPLDWFAVPRALSLEELTAEMLSDVPSLTWTPVSSEFLANYQTTAVIQDALPSR